MHSSPVAWIDGTVEQYPGGTNTLLLGVECGRLAAVFQRDGRVVEQTPRHDDRTISRKQLFMLMILDRSHAFLQRCVLRCKSKHAAIGAPILLCGAVHEVVVVLV